MAWKNVTIDFKEQPMNQLGIMGLVSAVAFVLTMWWNYESTISDLNSDIDNLRMELNTAIGSTETEKQNNRLLRSTIESMNSEAEKLNQKYLNSIAKYNELKNQPPEIKYETLYKYISKEKSNDCEDIKRAIDNGADYINNGL